MQAGYEVKDDAESTAVAVKKSGKGKKGKKSDDPFEEFATPSGSGPIPSYTDSFSLTSFHAASRSRALEQAQASLVDSVRNVSFSGWNPPPGNRALQGDLSYLEITTAEGLQAHVTANQEGFYLNQSTSSVFNPERAETHYKSLTLVELLRKISPSFQSKWHKVRPNISLITRTTHTRTYTRNTSARTAAFLCSSSPSSVSFPPSLTFP